jgi:hypothetical protein
MTWIGTIDPREWDDDLRAAAAVFRGLYPPEYGREVESLRELAAPDRGGGITQSHTLIPAAFAHAFALHGELLSPDLPLSRAQQETIAVAVSAANDCFY